MFRLCDFASFTFLKVLSFFFFFFLCVVVVFMKASVARGKDSLTAATLTFDVTPVTGGFVSVLLAFLFCSGPCPQRMEAPRQGAESELQALLYHSNARSKPSL